MTVDPFAPQASAPADDPFGSPTGGGSYPKVPELYGKLICLEGVKIDTLPKPAQFGGKPGETIERATVDTTVFEEDGAFETFAEMFWSQLAIVGEVKKAMRRRVPLLGVLSVKVNKNSPKDMTTEQLRADPMFRQWLATVAMPTAPSGLKAPYNFTWYLEEATPAQKSRAIAWYQQHHNPFANAA